MKYYSKDDHGAVAFPVMEANAIAAVVGYQLAPHGMLLAGAVEHPMIFYSAPQRFSASAAPKW